MLRDESGGTRVLNKFRKLKEKPYWGNHLWAGGYCVDTVGLDSEMIQGYVKYQEAKEKEAEKQQYQSKNVMPQGTTPLCLLGGAKALSSPCRS
ncbi:MAG: transposase [Syntrophobacter sp.]